MVWWENDFVKLTKKRLTAAGRDVTDLAEEYGTPLFIYSRQRIRSNFRSMMKAFHENTAVKPQIHFAMKANSHPEILKIIHSEGGGIMAASPGEVGLARSCGFSGNRIHFNGTNWSREDLRKVLCHQGIQITIDAEEQIDLLEEVKRQWFPHRPIKIAFRLKDKTGPEAAFHSERTGYCKSISGKEYFGIEEGRMLHVFDKAAGLGFNPTGLHHHTGSSWTKLDFSAAISAADRLILTARKLSEKGYQLEYLNFGGGFSHQTSEETAAFPIQDYIRHINKQIMSPSLKIKALVFEPGKYLVGDSGILLMRIEYIRKNLDFQIACVNTGTLNSIPGPVFDSSRYHPIIHGNRPFAQDQVQSIIAGNLSETWDIFTDLISLPASAQGDILAVLFAGAYCRSMASRYNCREIPRELML